MKVSELLSFIPDQELDFLSAQTKVDHQVKKLSGKHVFKLILYSMLNSNKASLRVMENFYHSASFRMLAGIDSETTRYNSIRDRIATINPDFFEKLFYSVFDKFSSHFNEKQNIVRFDSTMISVSSSLINWGLRVGSNPDKSQLKYTIGLKGSLPCKVKLFSKQKYLSEEIAIAETIEDYGENNESIIVFDRGLQARKTFDLFTDDDIHFVTRLKLNTSYEVLSQNQVVKNKPPQSSVSIVKDLNVRLGTIKTRKSKHILRLIIASVDKTNEPIYFLTNIRDLSAYQVAEIYKDRWQIEVFFKFLKQELNLDHLVSRTPNGMKVMLYMTLILSILIIAFAKSNKMAGYKIPKLKFSNELESYIVKQIVILCGGNPEKAIHLFNDE